MEHREHRKAGSGLVARYVRDFGRLLESLDMEKIEKIAGSLAAVRQRGGMTYIAGNGGSAAIASHWVNDLGKATKKNGHPPMRVISLSDNVSWLTALANDEGYERVFSGQLENFARRGDVLVVISSSGNSMNLLDAVAVAKTRGVETMAFLGFDGGKLKNEVDEYVLIPTEPGAYGLVEPAHEMICHIVTACLAEKPEGSGDLP